MPAPGPLDTSPAARALPEHPLERALPWAMLALTLVPALAGTARLAQIAGTPPVTPENVRFLESPVATALHIAGSLAFCLGGALQSAPGLRRRRPDLHRGFGRFLLPAGLVSALTGLWMTWTFPQPPLDGPALSWVRTVAGAGMLAALGLGVRAVVRRDLASHRAWMLRAQAIALGAGTQVLTHIPWFLFPSIQTENVRTALMAAGWAINLAVAEHLVRHGRRIASDRLAAAGRG